MSVAIRQYDGKHQTWEVDIIVRLADGTRHRERRTLSISKSAALRWGQDRERHLLRHGPARQPEEVLEKTEAVPEEVVKLAAFVPEYLAAARTKRDKASTILAKQSIIDQHLVPHLGRKRLNETAVRDVEVLKDALVKRSLKMQNNVLTVLSDFGAVARGVIEKARVRSLG